MGCDLGPNHSPSQPKSRTCLCVRCRGSTSPAQICCRRTWASRPALGTAPPLCPAFNAKIHCQDRMQATLPLQRTAAETCKRRGIECWLPGRCSACRAWSSCAGSHPPSGGRWAGPCCRPRGIRRGLPWGPAHAHFFFNQAGKISGVTASRPQAENFWDFLLKILKKSKNPYPNFII